MSEKGRGHGRGEKPWWMEMMLVPSAQLSGRLMAGWRGVLGPLSSGILGPSLRVNSGHSEGGYLVLCQQTPESLV